MIVFLYFKSLFEFKVVSIVKNEYCSSVCFLYNLRKSLLSISQQKELAILFNSYVLFFGIEKKDKIINIY